MTSPHEFKAQETHGCLATRFPDLTATLLGVGLLASVCESAASRLAESTQAFLEHYCWDCHSGDDPEGGLDLEVDRVDWKASATIDRWTQVHRVLEHYQMPPRKADQPQPKEREQVLDWLGEELELHSPVGGTRIRRLNRAEFENTIRDLFELQDYTVPDAFPADDSLDGFDNIGEGLILSPPLMEQFLETAGAIADAILPPPSPTKEAIAKEYSIGPAGLTTDKGGGAGLAGNRYRLASSRNMASAAGWPARFEAPESGIYKLSIKATAYQTDRMFYPKRSAPLQLEVYARRNGDQFYDFFDNLRRLAVIEIPANGQGPVNLTRAVELYQNEVFGLRWANGPAYSDPPVREFSTNFLADRLLKDRRYYAAMLQVKGGPRGTTQAELYERTRQAMESDSLNLDDPRLDSLPKVWGGGISDAPHNWIKAYVLEELHRFGPAIDILDVSIEGPIKLVEDEETRIRTARTKRFLGERRRGETDRSYMDRFVTRFLPQAFRRPVDQSLIDDYVELAMNALENEAKIRVQDALHLVLRRALVSPRFLYRGMQEGALDDHDLASRLSYFLWSAPPDNRLRRLADAGKLSQLDVLEDETLRLLRHERSRSFVKHFTGQWLGTRILKDIMPDPRLLPFFDYDREIMIEETQLFFAAILDGNLPLESFIEPGFSFRNQGLNKIYGGDLEGGQMRRVELKKGSRQGGGILGLASVMMATANGVDTQPILRGVWLLENVLGMPPPEPPDNVPAIAPDTAGKTTVRELLDAHRADRSCARCHDSIDPLGMVLENFDPVGRWRDHYPIYTEAKNDPLKEEFYKNIGKGTKTGIPIHPEGSLPDGYRLNDVTDLKRYLVERIELFSQCLAEKLLVYATGRPLGFGDRRIVDQLVADRAESGNGFRDMIVAVVQSEAFRTK